MIKFSKFLSDYFLTTCFLFYKNADRHFFCPQGLVSLEGGKQVMLQGVQDTYDSYPLDREVVEAADTTLVLIGKHLDGERLQLAFSKLLSSCL
jgi:hypothetical protein